MGELEVVGAAVADAGAPAEVRSFHLPVLDRRRLAAHDGCQRANRIQHSGVSTTTQLSKASHFNFICIANDTYRGQIFNSEITEEDSKSK